MRIIELKFVQMIMTVILCELRFLLGQSRTCFISLSKWKLIAIDYLFFLHRWRKIFLDEFTLNARTFGRSLRISEKKIKNVKWKP